MQRAPTQLLGSDRQTSTLVVVETELLASQLLAEHAVLFLKILHHLVLTLVQPACKGDEEQPKRIHRRAHYGMVTPQATAKRAQDDRPGCLCNPLSSQASREFGQSIVVCVRSSPLRANTETTVVYLLKSEARFAEALRRRLD